MSATPASVQPAEAARRHRRRFKIDRDVEEWHGRYVRYDIVKEFTIALIVVLLITVVASILFSSPDDRPVTLRSWATTTPVDFAQTAITELDGTSGTAGYGPPYNSTAGASQDIVGPISLESAFGVHHPINTMQDYVIGPLETLPNAPVLRAELTRYTSASPSLQQKWTGAYEKGVAKATFSGGTLQVPPGNYGPVAPMISSLTSMARSGALDGALVSSRQFYGTDYTKPLLFLADGTYLANLGQAQHLQGGQWGMMNETGSYPGQAWLWLYTMWYQISPFTTSSNADAQIWAIMMILTLLLALVPFIPGVRSIPRRVGLYRLIWRRHYRSVEAGEGAGSAGPPAAVG